MRKLLVVFLVIILLVTSSVAVANAKPDKPVRPEKLNQIIFVHPVAPDKPGKPDAPPGKPPKEEEPKDNSGFALWGGYLPGTVDYYINPDVSLVTGGDVIAAVSAAAESWDIVTGAELFNYAGTTARSWYAEDGQNTISWVKFLPRDYIAVAVMWYDENFVIWEVDIVFNTFHSWGIDPVKKDRAFDVQNIAAHEFGHPVGLDDLYQEIYSEVTMYGYSTTSETKKRSLEEGDLTGAQTLYGVP